MKMSGCTLAALFFIEQLTIDSKSILMKRLPSTLKELLFGRDIQTWDP